MLVFHWSRDTWWSGFRRRPGHHRERQQNGGAAPVGVRNHPEDEALGGKPSRLNTCPPLNEVSPTTSPLPMLLAFSTKQTSPSFLSEGGAGSDLDQPPPPPRPWGGVELGRENEKGKWPRGHFKGGKVGHPAGIQDPRWGVCTPLQYASTPFVACESPKHPLGSWNLEDENGQIEICETPITPPPFARGCPRKGGGEQMRGGYLHTSPRETPSLVPHPQHQQQPPVSSWISWVPLRGERLTV